MTDQTPRTEAGPYSKIIDGALLAMEREYERGLADALREAADRVRALVTWTPVGGSEMVTLADVLAILAGETE